MIILKDDKLQVYWDYLVESGIATEEELRLVTCINGYDKDSLDSILYARTGYRNLKQYIKTKENTKEQILIYLDKAYNLSVQEGIDWEEIMYRWSTNQS